MRSKTKKIDDNWIVNQLRQERYERGISLSELAKNIGVSKSSISDWENHRKIPTLDNVIVWAVGLGFHLDLSKRSLKDS